jgi:hypothetical protein
VPVSDSYDIGKRQLAQAAASPAVRLEGSRDPITRFSYSIFEYFMIWLMKEGQYVTTPS